MAGKLRLRRMGRKKLSVFSLVATDTRSPRDGRFIEDLGRYEPVAEPARVSLNADRILYWLREGAQPTDTVRNLLSQEGIMLHLHLLRKGKTEEEIEQAVSGFRTQRAEKQPTKKSAEQRRREALEAERKVAADAAKKIEEERAAREAELEKQRQEAEDAARAERQAADAAAADAADEATDEATSAPDAAEQAEMEAVAEATAEEAADAGPEAAEEQPAVQAETAETVADEAGEDVAEQTDAAAEEQPEVEEAAAEEPAAEEGNEDAGEVPVATPEQEVQVPTDEAEEAPAAEAPAAESDDLTKIWGIGPVFAGLLSDHGITTFAQLAQTDVEQLRTIVNESGTSAAAANEESWARQAELAGAGDWDGLEAYVEELKNA